MTLLSNENAHHIVKLSPNKNYFIDTYSTRSTAPVTVIRELSGKVVMTVEEADIKSLIAEGWTAPIRFKTKGREGKYDFYGYIVLPKDLKKDAKYPVIDYIYPGPQIGPIRTHGFTSSPSSQGHALAELGFIVFVVDALGTPYRSKEFHDGYYADMGDNGLPDHISALKELSKEYPIDLDRIGIYGHSGGGFSSTDAILRHPDFFKVAVSGAGNHDNRGYYFEWGEKYQGLLKELNDVNYEYFKKVMEEEPQEDSIGMNSDHTLEEVGQQFSVTRERIRQIEAKALRKLKHPTRAKKLKTFLDE